MQTQLCKLGWTFLLESGEEGRGWGGGWGGGWRSKPSAAICVIVYITPEEVGETGNLHWYCSSHAPMVTYRRGILEKTLTKGLNSTLYLR